jgi:hypothetical protein
VAYVNKHISRVYAHELIARQCTYDFLFSRFVCKGVAAETPAGLLEAIYMLLDPLDVFETQFGLDDFHVAERINVSLDVDHFRIVEGANDLEDAIDGTYVGEERVPETCTSRGALDSISLPALVTLSSEMTHSGKTSNIDAGQMCGNAGGGFVKLA